VLWDDLETNADVLVPLHWRAEVEVLDVDGHTTGAFKQAIRGDGVDEDFDNLNVGGARGYVPRVVYAVTACSAAHAEGDVAVERLVAGLYGKHGAGVDEAANLLSLSNLLLSGIGSALSTRVRGRLPLLVEVEDTEGVCVTALVCQLAGQVSVPREGESWRVLGTYVRK
jgi:hypothetical protein